MDSAILGAAAGVLGALVGASTSIMGSWITQRTLSKRELTREEIDKRERLYGEFIGECSKLIIDAYEHAFEDPEKLLPAYALVNRIRLTASDAVLTEAEHIVRKIAEQYFSPNLSTEDLRALVRSPENDVIRPFGEACRAELKSIRAHV